MTVYADVCAKSNMHLCWLISIDAENACVCVCVTQMGHMKEKVDKR